MGYRQVNLGETLGETLVAALGATVGGALGALYRVKKMAIFEIK